MVNRNKFEMYAHDIQYKKKIGQQHPHTIDTYTKGKTDWVMIIGSLFIVGFGVALVLTLLLKV